MGGKRLYASMKLCFLFFCYFCEERNQNIYIYCKLVFNLLIYLMASKLSLRDKLNLVHPPSARIDTAKRSKFVNLVLFAFICREKRRGSDLLMHWNLVFK
jgi:hypothetical protein